MSNPSPSSKAHLACTALIPRRSCTGKYNTVTCLDVMIHYPQVGDYLLGRGGGRGGSGGLEQERGGGRSEGELAQGRAQGKEWGSKIVTCTMTVSLAVFRSGPHSSSTRFPSPDRTALTP